MVSRRKRAVRWGFEKYDLPGDIPGMQHYWITADGYSTQGSVHVLGDSFDESIEVRVHSGKRAGEETGATELLRLFAAGFR